MVKNYLHTTYRHIVRNKVNFIFKLGGLTMALLGSLIIAIYVNYQFSFDKFHEDYKSIFRVNSIRDEDGKLEKYVTVPPAVGPALKSEFPEVLSFSRITDASRLLIKHNESLMRCEGFVYADNSILDVFTFKFIRGERKSIDRPGTIILSLSAATRIFGEENPVGKLISLPEKNNEVLEVVAIFEDFPANTHRSFAAIIPFREFNNDESIDNSWEITLDGSVFLYVRLHPQTNPHIFEEKLQGYIKSNIARHDDNREMNFSIFLQPIEDIYLSPGFKMEFFKKGNRFYVYIFSLLGIFLLVIASINYINLSIVDFQSRGKEMGIRKILGARRRQILMQLAGEALFYCLAALLISLIILYSLFPHISNQLEPNLKAVMIFDPMVVGIILISIFLIVIFSTAYPAFKFFMNRPSQDLKKEMVFGRDLTVGKFLLLTQFVITILCLSITLVVSEQLSYVEARDLGFDRSNLVTLLMPDEYPLEKAEVLKSELKRLDGVEEVSYSYYLVTGVPYLKDWYKVEIGNTMKQVQLNEIFVDHEFFFQDHEYRNHSR